MKQIKILLLLLPLMFISCGGQAPVVKTGKPKWTLIPPNDGAIYGVGISPRHIRGVAAQRLYAISLAIDEIARQKNITVSNTFEKLEEASKSSSSKSMRSYSIQSVDGVSVSAKMVDAYDDTYNETIYILMKEEQ